jgi:hypothetical protein
MTVESLQCACMHFRAVAPGSSGFSVRQDTPYLAYMSTHTATSLFNLAVHVQTVFHFRSQSISIADYHEKLLQDVQMWTSQEVLEFHQWQVVVQGLRP